MSRCVDAVSLERLASHWVDRAGPVDEALEEHIFRCSACTARLGWLASLAEAIPAVVEGRGGPSLALTCASVEHLARRGVRIRQYQFDDSREIACTVAPDDDLVVAFIPIEVAEDEQVSGVMRLPDGSEATRVDDIPVDRPRGMIVLADPAERIMLLPDTVLRLQLSATSPRGRRELGEFVYRHTAPR